MHDFDSKSKENHENQGFFNMKPTVFEKNVKNGRTQFHLFHGNKRNLFFLISVQFWLSQVR